MNLLMISSVSLAATKFEDTPVIVTATLLNGRAEPKKKSEVTARFDNGDVLTAISWSKNHHWIEVRGGETGTSWVWWQYLTETEELKYFYNDTNSKVKIRKEPYGRVIGYLKKGNEILVDQTLFGWGHCSKGWVDLNYLREED